MNLQDNVKGGRHTTQLGQKCNQNFSQTFSQDTAAFRTETDGIGTKEIPKDAYYGVHALLLDYGKGKHLIHAFPALNPYLPESVDAMSRILQWFASK